MGKKCKRAISLFTSLATLLWLSGAAFLPMASAATINEGDIITGPDGIKVYIVNANGYKRHIFNPEVFNMYGHLSWSNIKSVDQATLDQYLTSDLYRVAGEPKVFAVTADGQKRHLNMTADEFIASGYSWGQVFIVNEKEGNYYTTGADLTYTGTVSPTPTPSTGTLSVGLTSDNPAASIIPAGVTGATYLKFNVSGITTINEVVLKRTGAGASADFVNVYLYDGETRLTSGKTISTDNNTATFVNLGLAVGTGKVLTAKADIATVANVAAITGRQDRLEVYSINGTTVTGVAGNLMSYANVPVATATIDNVGAAWNVTLGASSVELAKFSIQETLGTSGDLSLKAITIRNAGSLSNSYLKNLVLKTSAGTQIGTVASMSGDKAIIVLDSAYTVPKSQTKNFVLYGDITGGRANDTVIFYLDQSADLNLVDLAYGYGSTLTNNWASGDQTVTAAGGDITLGFNGPAATTYAKDTTGQDLLKFSLTPQKNVSVEKTLISIALSLNGGAVLANTAVNQYDHITNIRLVDLATGNTLVGPLTAADVTYTTNDATYGGYKVFTDKFDLTAGTTKQLAVRADINTNIDVTVANGLKAWVSFAGLAGATTNYMYDTDASEYIAIAKIVPSNQLGNTITIGSATLTAAKASTPVSATYVKGASAVEGLGIIFTAGAADSVKLTKLVVRAYGDDTTSAFDNAGYGSVAANTLISTASLYDDAGTLIKGPVNPTLVGTIGADGGYYKYEFQSLGYSIAAGAQKKLIVKVASTNTFTGTKYLALDVKGTEDIEGEDSKGTSLTFVGAAQLNLAAAPSPVITLAQAGTLTAAVDAGTPSENIAVGGTTGVEFTKYKFTARNEAMKIVGLQLINANSGTAGDYDNNLGKVTVSYPKDAAGTLEEKSGYFSGGTLTFSQDQVAIYVPKNGSAVMTVKADIKTVADGATSGELPRIGLTKAAGQWTNTTNNLADTFIVQGVDSGTTVKGNTDSVTLNNNTVKQMAVRDTKPTLASGTLSSTTLAPGTNTFYKFTVSADSANDVYWNAVAFTVSGSLGNGTNLLTIGTDATSTTADGIYIIVAAGADTQAVSNIKLYNTGTGTQVAGTFTYRADTNATGYTLYFVSTAEETVAKGTTKTYELRGDFNISNAGTSGLGSISTKIADSTAAFTNAGAAAATVEASSADSFTTTTTTAESFVWSDGSSTLPVHSLTSLDWTDDWKVAGVPTTTLTLK